MDALDAAPRPPRSTPFGSVWDRQLGSSAPRPAASGLAPLPEDEEDLAEPEIPEYLIAERRQAQGQGGRGGGGRGGSGRGGGNRAAYAAAIDRERYGGGRSSGGVSRYPDTSRSGGGSSGGGRSSAPSRGGQPPRGPRQDRPERFDRAPRGTSSEPWSEVPPELEELLRAQMAQSKPATRAGPVEPDGRGGRGGPGPEGPSDPRSHHQGGGRARRRGGRDPSRRPREAACDPEPDDEGRRNRGARVGGGAIRN